LESVGGKNTAKMIEYMIDGSTVIVYADISGEPMELKASDIF